MGGNSSKEARRGPVLNPVNPDDCPVLSSRNGSSGASASGADTNCPIPERYRGGGGGGGGVYNVYNQRIDGGCGPWTSLVGGQTGCCCPCWLSAALTCSEWQPASVGSLPCAGAAYEASLPRSFEDSARLAGRRRSCSGCTCRARIAPTRPAANLQLHWWPPSFAWARAWDASSTGCFCLRHVLV